MHELRRPNILLIYTDQQRRDSLQCYGAQHAISPNLDTLANQGVRLNQYHVNNPVCMPSRISFLTGRYCSSLGIGANGIPFPDDAVALQHLLKPYGYVTAQFGKLHFDPHAKRDHRNPTSTYGFDWFELSDEPGCYDDAYTKWVATVAPDELPKVRTRLPPAAFHYGHPNYSQRIRDDVDGYCFEGDEHLTHSSFVAAETCRFLEQAPRAQPFFAIAGFYAPHTPLNPPERFVDMIDPSLLPAPKMHETERAASPYKDTTPEAWRKMAQYYYALCAHVDDCIGRILRELERTSRVNNTIVIFTTDHGEYLGDHGRIHKGPPGHDPIVRVPFLVRWPGHLPEGKVVEDMVEGVDILPTLLDYAGVQTPGFVQGRSVRAALEGEDSRAREDVLIEFFDSPGMGSHAPHRQATLKTREFLYNLQRDGAELLCDRTEDPDEFLNIASDPDYAEPLAKMRKRLAVRLLQAASAGEKVAEY